MMGGICTTQHFFVGETHETIIVITTTRKNNCLASAFSMCCQAKWPLLGSPLCLANRKHIWGHLTQRVHMQAISLIDDTLWNLQGRYWFIGTKMPWTPCCCHNGLTFTMLRQSEKPKSNPSTLAALLPTEGWKTRTGPKRRLGDIWDHMRTAGAINAIIYSFRVWWVNDGSGKEEGPIAATVS